MPPQVEAALIAGIISFIGILISSYISARQIKQQESTLRKQLQRSMTEKLYELRLKVYPRAFEITEKIKQKRAPQFINTTNEIEEILNELVNWKNGEASLALSNESLFLYGELIKRLKKKTTNEREFFSQKQAENICKASSEFRRFLRKDLGFLFGEDL